MDGIDEYRGHEFDWAVDTVIENADAVGLLEGAPDAERFVAAVWDFIYEVFDMEGIEPPDRDELVSAIQAKLTELISNRNG